VAEALRAVEATTPVRRDADLFHLIARWQARSTQSQLRRYARRYRPDIRRAVGVTDQDL
jgi:hypothetical protein